MKFSIKSNLIWVVLYVSLATSTNILKRPSSPLPQKSCKKQLLCNYSQESASHQDKSLPSVASVHSLLPKKTVTDFSVAAILNLPTNINDVNVINSTPNSIIELSSDTEPEESFASDKNSSSVCENSYQPKTSKDCSNDGISLSVSTQSKSSLPNESDSIDQELQLRKRKGSKRAPNSMTKKTSSITINRKTSKNPLVINFPYGILSWSQADVDSKPFTNNFQCGSGKFFRLHFGSDNLIDLLSFKYAVNTFNLFFKSEKISNEEYELKAIKSVYAIFSTITSLPPHLIIHYHSFSKSSNDVNRSVGDCLRIPFYFLFTTISFLLKNDQNENAQYLKPLLKLAYQRILDAHKFGTCKWDFLKDFLSQYFDRMNLNSDAKIRHKNMHFDISTVSFIYHEMRFGSSERVKSFFNQVWETSKQECNRKNDLLQISNSPEMSIPSKADKCLNIFEREMRKLYQIEFTNLLFKKWNRMEDLLEEFSQLKSFFNTTIVDFRLKAFCLKDFESLNKALKQIYLLIEKFSFNDKTFVRPFLVELEYFINFKCFLFIFDFCNELEESGSGNYSCQKTFKSIESVLKSFERIRSISSNYFELNPTNLDTLKADSDIQSLPLKKWVEKCLQFIESIDQKIFSRTQDDFDKFLVCLNNFDYFERKFTNYLSSKLSRFKIVEFTDKFIKILKNNDEKKIAKVFSDKKYEPIRELWKCIPKELSKTSFMEGKKLYLERFTTFLILHNQ